MTRTELIERLGAAEGPDRGLDAEIVAALTSTIVKHRGEG